ncbi:response regulator [Allochromatium palmeri]|uniref:histidine kinase n=1 Tax=Allochromatium palmeri TaxID=231048 RepID=A0A6N8EBT7_9GAMM|nr:response regulator [Allochromatium palmeri]MTW21635.1 response regulator [Allochromatium palmeri]
MTPSNAYELLHELSRVIDDSIALEPMLQHFLSALLRVLGGSGAAVLESPASTPPGQTPTVCLNPEHLPRDPLYGAFWEDWSPATLETALAERPPGGPVILSREAGQVLALRLPGFGLLILVRPETVGVLPPELQQGLGLVATTLAIAARGARRAAETRYRAENMHLAKSRRIADISREIRVPLKDILELSELTLHTPVDPPQRDYLHLIRSSAASLLVQIDDLLDFTHIETGQLTIEQIPFNPSVLIADLVDTLATAAQRQGRELHYEPIDALPTHSQGDPGRIRQVLTTLWNAALAFGHSDRLCLRTQSLATEDSELDVDWLQVSLLVDLGLQQAELQALIDPDTTAGEISAHRFGDTGLRLTTCARLIEYMGGRIWLDTQDAGGLHFTLPLPRLSASGTTPQPQANWPGRRALLVDNQAVTRRTLAYWFRHWGFEVQEASTGRQALELARTYQQRGQEFDVYVFDSTLPEFDGFELAARLRESVTIERRALLMLASIGQRGDAQRCRAVGIDAFLTKPASPRELRELLTRLLAPGDSPQEHALLTRHRLIEDRQRLRILLVESGLLHQKLASTLLQEWGHETLIVNSGGLAVEQFRSETYDLVFLDLYLPDVDGIEVARAMRRLEEPGAYRTPIIGMSTLGLDSERARCLESGLDEYITKPLNPVVLEALIQRLVKRGDESPL